MKLSYITGILEANLNRSIMNIIHPFGTIRPQDFPPVPQCKTGYRWIDGGEVKMIPTKSWESDWECDANTKMNDHTNYSALESNLLATGFDHSFEPGHAVPIPGTEKVSGKTARTRHKIFSDYNDPYYPVRLMEPMEGYDERVSSFTVAMCADLEHKPARSLSMEQIAQSMWVQKNKGLCWYHGQPVNHITGEVIYGDDEFDYAYDVELKINQVFCHKTPRGKIKSMVMKGFSTAVKINDKDEQTIKYEIKDNDLGNGYDGYKIVPLVMDDAAANAPNKLAALFQDSQIKVRQVLFTKRATTAEEVKNLRELWRKTLYSYAKTYILYSLTNKYITRELKEEIIKERLETLFANFELYGYNHLEDELDFVKIDMFTKYF